MDRITVRLPPDLTRRFDAAAAARGGRSRLLRRLIERAAEAALPAVLDAPKAAASVKLTLRLAEPDLAVLAREAARTGLSRTQWSVALLRRRLHDRPQFTPVERVELVEVRRELRRIGVNINQIARALNTAVMEGHVLDLEVAQLANFQTEIAAWVDALGDAFQGNLDYWRDRS
ncbi:plasmid mobilization relaxosome protein MobC [Brevundimonas naejangsanensis]|uniref:plasmid mobilization relaxosome protein MobC n=1 Tax=Brevundimonas naejangsanensis TaxID=588932 RepID=UPI003209F736